MKLPADHPAMPDRSTTSKENSLTQRLFWPVLIVLAIAAVYAQIIGYDFVWFDDQLHALENPHFRPLTLKSYFSFWTEPYQQLYIPVSYSFFTVLTLLGPHLPGKSLEAPGGIFNPCVFHASSLLLHMANSLLVYFILKRWTKKRAPAAIGALFFALHPLQTESVAWISEIRGLLAAFFGLSAVALYCVRGRERNAKYLTRYIFATLLFVLAVLSKPSAAPFPIAAAALDRLISNTNWKTAAKEMSIWLLISLGDILITRGAQPVNPQATYSILQTPGIVAASLLFYLEKLVLPIGLCADYGEWPKTALASSNLFFEIVLAVVIAAAGIWAGAKRKWIWASGLVSLALIAPVSGVIAFGYQFYSIYADRYAYASMLGAAMVFARIAGRLRGRRTAQALFAAILAVCGTLSFVQAQTWRNTRALASHIAAVAPGSAIGHATLAFLDRRNAEKIQEQMDISSAGQQGALQEEFGADVRAAMEEAKLAIEWRPTNSTPYLNLGILYDDLNQPNLALGQYEDAVRFSSNDAMAHMRLGNCWLELGNVQAAYIELTRAEKIDSNYPKLHFYLGNLYSQTKNFPAATSEFDKELALSPRDSQTYMNRGIAYLEEKRLSPAAADMRRAIAIGPAKCAWWTNLAVADEALGNRTALESDLDQALALSPDDPAAKSWKNELQKKDTNRK